MTEDRSFPQRAVRLIEPFGSGGGPDLVARALAERLSELWEQPVTVENHPGAGSTAAPALVANSRSDGYTLLVNTSAHAYCAAVASDLPYDPVEDFIAVAALSSQPYVLVAGAWTGITSIAALIEAANFAPGEVRFASAGLGTGTHIALEKLNRDTGITAVHVPAGPADAITDVIAGCVAAHTAYAMSPISIAAPHLERGDLMALGVSTARRSSRLPHVPPLAEAGIEGYDFPFWYGLWAPARTPAPIVDKVAQGIARALARREMIDWLTRHDGATMTMTQTEFADFVISEREVAARLMSNG